MEKLPLSVAIITYNEEDIIGRTLEAVKDIASEIVVVDSHSTDRTRDIAKSYGAKVYVEDWKGYVAQKNSALEKCTQEWILFLDADEVLSERLKESIREALKDPKADGYMVNRKLFYMGKVLKHAFQPEWRLRLVKKDANPRWEGKDPHDRLEIEGRIMKLEGELIHYSYKSFKDHVIRIMKYSSIMAKQMYNSGYRFKTHDLILRPIWAFVKAFFIKKGFMDGYRGFIVSAMAGYYTLLKYSFLAEMCLINKTGRNIWRSQVDI